MDISNAESPVLRSMSTQEKGSQEIETIAVIGAGTMGHGIAQVAGAAGFQVLLSDVDRESLARGIRAIEKNLAKGLKLGKLTEAMPIIRCSKFRVPPIFQLALQPI